MAADWYFKEMGEEVGPVSANTLRKYAQEGRIATDTYVRNGADGKWLWAERVKGLFDPSPPVAKTPSNEQAKEPAPQLSPVEKACPSCQTVLPPRAVLCVHCGFDLRTGKKLTGPATSAIARPKALIVGGVAAGVVIAAAAAIFFLTRGEAPEKGLPVGAQAKATKEPPPDPVIIPKKGGPKPSGEAPPILVDKEKPKPPPDLPRKAPVARPVMLGSGLG
ncbi:MAG: DUF4339 domain-containing protein [Planctomycetes bacterium]|nr:DUF4339 domain-containing protein [Planctomycetota bacterium]